jgi:hypothetical protein
MTLLCLLAIWSSISAPGPLHEAPLRRRLAFGPR